MFLIWVETFILVILFLYFLRTILSHALTWRHMREEKDRPPLDGLPPISIVKPVRGLDQGAEENFLSFIHSGYPAPFEVIFCVEERDDPVVPLIQRLFANIQSTQKVHLIFSKRQDRREMGKTINLIAGIKESSYDVLVLSDSDVRNAPGFLEELVRPLADSRIGITYACPVYKGAVNWVAGLLALAVNETFIALSTAPPFTVIGSTLALRKEVLHAIGGLTPMRHRVGIDAALGRAVWAKGYRIHRIKQPVTVIHPHATFEIWWQQMHRWLVTIRCYLGWRYLLVFLLDFPLVWALLYLFLTLAQGRIVLGLALFGIMMTVRLTSCALSNFLYFREPGLWRYLWLFLPLDFLKFTLWLESYFNPYVVWRGRRYRVMADATVRPVS